MEEFCTRSVLGKKKKDPIAKIIQADSKAHKQLAMEVPFEFFFTLVKYLS